MLKSGGETGLKNVAAGHKNSFCGIFNAFIIHHYISIQLKL